MKPALHSQRGMTLLVSLIMLIVITMFVVSMVRLNNINAAIVGNMRAQKVVDTEAAQALEIAVNQFNFFNDVITGAALWTGASTDAATGSDNAGGLTYLTESTVWTNYTPTGATAQAAVQSTSIWVYRPQCLYYEPASGYSALSGVAPQDTYWDIQAKAVDTTTNASSEIHQGITMRLPAGNCS